MTEEKELVKKRGSYKGRLTHFINYFNSLQSCELDADDISELQLRISKLEDVYEQFDKIQTSLECLAEELETCFHERNSFESQYFKYVAKAKQMVEGFHKAASVQSEASSRAGNHKLVKLPTIQLPKFSGSYNNWLEFRDTFLSLIHSNDDIDEINKFHYLRASLDGTAAVVIQSIEFSGKNYANAWTLLCERFDNKRLLVQHHVSALFSIESISKESSFVLKRVIDQINKNLRALKSLGEPVEYWDTLLIYMITQKLDSNTFREWEEFKGRLHKEKSINLDSFLEFMRNRADLMETLEFSHRRTTGNSATKSNKIKSMVSVQGTEASSASSTNSTCPKCDGDHQLWNCPQFLALTSEARLDDLSTFKICFNCFHKGHFANHCKKPGCKICKRKHNTLIHVTDFKTKQAASSASNQSNKPSPPESAAEGGVVLSASINSSSKLSVQHEVLLSTALIKIHDKCNREVVARAVLDSGSTSCIMTEDLCDKLNLDICEIDKSLVGVNNVLSHVGKMCKVSIKSLNDEYKADIQCFILPSITSNVPSQPIDLSSFNIPSNICLADPNFHTPGGIDLILGADIFWDLLGSQRIKLGFSNPMLCESKLGWLVCGPTASIQSSKIKCNFVNVNTGSVETLNDNIQNQMSQFWKLEEVSDACQYSQEEKLCEDHFVENTTRMPDGRFCVKIPFKQNPDLLGDSVQRAKRCFLSLERRNNARLEFDKMYKDFMLEYETLGHMSQVSNNVSKGYFIPHHGVLRESSLTTKLRVVFNASSPTTSGLSLNDILMVGPPVQDDLFSILLRFRQHRYILAADVEKMYRQIAVHSDDRHLQQIIWRDDSSAPLKVFQLNTVTYGTASAPFLATRCLKQVGIECKDSRVSEIIIHDFYVDDLLTGTDNMDDAKFIRQEVTSELNRACMNLRKWKSNEPELMSETPCPPLDLNIGNSEPSKTLGLGWLTQSDELCFSADPSSSLEYTKREMLSIISQIFDPMGLLAPSVIQMKMLLQKLWLQKLSWDERLPAEIKAVWADFVKSLSHLSNLRIPRRVVCNNYQSVEIHVFSDASERAYGACLFVRSVSSCGEILVRLLTAKSRVAPLKPTTIPRLELCAALVGARLYQKVVRSLRLQISEVTFWTDSMIVLGWLKMSPNKLHTFVRNRVGDILESTSTGTWRHVPTDSNPADYISRGVDLKSIQSLEEWWSGPSFLKKGKSFWPVTPSAERVLPELRPEVALHSFETDLSNNFIDFNRFSNYLRLVRAVAYLLRFVKLCKKETVVSNYISSSELQEALNVIIKISQRESFPEYALLLNRQPLPKKSPLLKFNVFLDDKNILRVGGRLSNSQFSYEKKYPILIQSTHHFTKLLFNYEHVKLKHAGPQLLLASIRDVYWPIGGRNLAKSCYRQCILCTRLKGQTISPIMGNLPQNRVIPNGFPFQSVGVDYAGPILSASRQGRGCRLTKVYIALFICFATKAVHIELVGDLTSNSYLSALRRFISRRGKPKNIYSDNGVSFVGAYNDLSKFLKSNCDSLTSAAAGEGIDFHFIPSYSPHFGGLWEAGVKSAKYHLQRVLGNCHLSFEDLYTVLVQIEAVLNSRPLTPLSSEPDDYMPLTPGHFIIGRPLTSLPSPDYQDMPNNRLTRFQQIEKLRQHFWSRWSKEYVSELQQRIKWRTNKDALKINSLVLLKEDNSPPLKWRLGRVVAVYPGTDGIVRVADVRTATGVVRRSFSRICPLPVFSASG